MHLKHIDTAGYKETVQVCSKGCLICECSHETTYEIKLVNIGSGDGYFKENQNENTSIN